MQVMLAMLVNLLESLDQIVKDDARSVLKVLKDLLIKLSGEDWEVWFVEIKKFLRKEPCWTKAQVRQVARPKFAHSFILTVDYGQSLEQMIAAGRYDSKDDYITAERFPIEGNGTVEFEAVIVEFDNDTSSEDAKKQIEEAGYEVGKIEHVLSFEAIYPEEQPKFPIIGLGTIGDIDGYRYVPYISGEASNRCLNLSRWIISWGPGCPFLAVRKKVSQTSAT